MIRSASVKKLTTIAIICGGITFVNAANAALSDYKPYYSRVYVEVGIESYNVNLPNYRLPITFGKWVASVPPTLPPTGVDAGFNAANTQAGNTTLLGNINIGYRLREGSQLFSRFFDQESIEFDYSQFNRATKDTLMYSGAPGVDAGAAYGIIWSINNVAVPIYGGGAVRLVDSFIHASVHYHSGGLYLKGNVKNLSPRFRSTAKVGVVFTTLDQYYAYNINATTQGLEHDAINTFGNTSLRSRYSGISIGDRIEYQYAPAFSVFVEANVQGLYSTTNLTTNQTPDALADPEGAFADYRNNIRLSSHTNNFTYRAQGITGIILYPKLFHGGSIMKLSAYVGLDQWGYVPQAVTVAKVGASMPHITSSSMKNFFVGANFTYPLG